MKAIILAISLYFVVSQIQAKSPVVDDTATGGQQFDQFQENNYRVRSLSSENSDLKQIRNPSSDKDEVKAKKEVVDPAPEPWPYSE
jgi:hypothetical protein